ncbi:protein of unknown function [Halomicrobium zhouii]|uniref:DUF4365 domain-containing protein n=1 Tax=Halomicrobium zhouii TaxID=767519 RepID=A0A1I6L9P9_9EURY|nr:DUF4365 domain-containing protein [Halomicrobium zhouii]SFS00179.1 protein of unknown function [Halomicrobium zhouii]
MANEGEDDRVKPAPYPESDKHEHDAVDVLNIILADSVKSSIDSRDKAPNHDGILEMVDEDNSPIGRLIIQVKKLPDDHIETPKKQMETRHLSYCYACGEPFLIIAVDVQNERAYWKNITVEWFENEDLHNQDYKTIHFPVENVISDSTEDYVEDWRDIADRTRKRNDILEKYQKLKRRSNPTIGKQRPEFRDIHTFLDKYHSLLDSDFEIVKEQLYPRIWKFGFGNIIYEEDELSYTLYPIEDDENDAQIRDIDSDWDEIHKLGANRMSGNPTDNPLRRDPKGFAYNALDHRVPDLFDEYNFDYSSCPFLAIEYIYPFISRFSALLGLEEKERYSVDEIREGYYRYLQFWLSEESKGIFQDRNVSDVHIVIDGFLEGESDDRYDHAHDIAQQRTEEAEIDPPLHRIIAEDYEQEVLERMINALVESSVDFIEKPYNDRDRMDPGSDVSNILEFYSDESIFENIQTYYTNYYKEYNNLAKSNFPALSEILIPSQTNFLLVVVDRDNLRDLRSTCIRRYWLEGKEQSLTVKCHWASDEEIPENYKEMGSGQGGVFEYEGDTYRTPYRGAGSQFMLEFDHSNRVVFDEVHRRMESEMKSYLAEKKVPIQYDS